MEARFAPAWLIDGRFPDGWSALQQARLLDLNLMRLARLDAQLDLAIGRGLMRLLGPSPAYQDLGASRVVDFARERLDLSVGAAYELRNLAHGLPGLPLLLEAFLSRTLSARKCAILLKVATPENEESWIALARTVDEKELRRRIQHDGGSSPAAPDPPVERWREVSWLATRDEAAAWHWGLEMLRVVVGEELPTWRLVELLVADAAASLPALPAPPEGAALPSRVRESRTATTPAWPLARRDEWRRLHGAQPVPPSLDLPDPGEPGDPWVVHARMLAARRLQAALSFERSALLALLSAPVRRAALGFRTIHAYGVARLGLSPRGVSEALRNDLETAVSPALRRAWHDGLPASVVAQIARVAGTGLGDDEAWVAFARGCSRKRLDTEVRWHEALQCTVGASEYARLTGGRPDVDAPESTRDLDWQRAFAVPGARLRNASAADDADPDHLALAAQAAGDLSRIRFRAPDAVAATFHAVVREWQVAALAAGREVPTAGSVVFTLLARMAHERGAAATPRWVREHRVFARDRWRCSTPFCTARRGLHAHHVRFRSRGGGNQDENLASHCAGCHALVHAERLQVTGRAPDELTYRVGRLPDGTWRETWRNGVRVA